MQFVQWCCRNEVVKVVCNAVDVQLVQGMCKNDILSPVAKWRMLEKLRFLGGVQLESGIFEQDAKIGQNGENGDLGQNGVSGEIGDFEEIAKIATF